VEGESCDAGEVLGGNLRRLIFSRHGLMGPTNMFAVFSDAEPWSGDSLTHDRMGGPDLIHWYRY
jgi:hypothetical protein